MTRRARRAFASLGILISSPSMVADVAQPISTGAAVVESRVSGQEATDLAWQVGQREAEEQNLLALGEESAKSDQMQSLVLTALVAAALSVGNAQEAARYQEELAKRVQELIQQKVMERLNAVAQARDRDALAEALKLDPRELFEGDLLPRQQESGESCLEAVVVEVEFAALGTAESAKHLPWGPAAYVGAYAASLAVCELVGVIPGLELMVPAGEGVVRIQHGEGDDQRMVLVGVENTDEEGGPGFRPRLVSGVDSGSSDWRVVLVP